MYHFGLAAGYGVAGGAKCRIDGKNTNGVGATTDRGEDTEHCLSFLFLAPGFVSAWRFCSDSPDEKETGGAIPARGGVGQDAIGA